MKSFKVLVLCMFLLVFSSAAVADVEVKASGKFRVSGNYLKDNDTDSFNVYQRLRTNFQFIANENVKAVWGVEIGNLRWGDEGARMNDNNEVNVKTRLLYLDFNTPMYDVNVRTGIQSVALPSIFGSHILDDRMGSVLVNKDMGVVSPTIGWARSLDNTTFNEDEVDVFLLILPIYMDSLTLTPFGTLTNVGKNVDNDKHQVYHGGLHSKLDFNPFVFKADVNYGYSNNDYKQQGYIVVVSAEYVMDVMTPQVFGFYETGEKETFNNTSKSRRMPVVGTDGGAFGPGWGYGGKTEFNDDKLLRNVLNDFDGSYQTWQGAVGSMGVGGALNDIRVIDRLSNDVIVYYMKGTNHENNVDLFNKKDSYYELNVNSDYALYENLSMIMELGYGKVDFDVKKIDNDHLYRGIVGLVYNF